MISELRKLRALIAICFEESIAYRASAFIWLLTDTVQVLLMPLVWLSAYNGREALGGFLPSQIVMYYLLMAMVSSFVTSHLMWDIAQDIKEGMLSQWLLRPVSVVSLFCARNLAWRLMRTGLLIPVLGLCALYYRAHFNLGDLHLNGWFWLSVLLGHLVSFAIGLALSNIAFWVQEVQSVFGLYYFPMLLFSGWVAPLSLMPGWAQLIADFLPFRYSIAVPVEIGLGQLTGDLMLRSILMQVFWLGLGSLLALALWKRGLRVYSGVGM